MAVAQPGCLVNAQEAGGPKGRERPASQSRARGRGLGPGGEDPRCITAAITILICGRPSPAITVTGDTQWPRTVLSAKHVSSLQRSSSPTPSAAAPCAVSARRGSSWDPSPGGPGLQLVALTTALHCPAHLGAEPALPCAEVAFLPTSTLCQPLNTYF